MQIAVTTAAVGLSLAFLRNQKFKKAAKGEGTRRLLKAPVHLHVVAYGSLVFWIVLIALSTIFPGKTSPGDLRWAQVVFACFGVLSLMCGFSLSCTIWWDDDSVAAPTWYGKTLRFNWVDITDAKFNRAMQGIALSTRTHQTIWIPEYWSGVADFVAYLEQRFPHFSLFSSPDMQLFRLDDNNAFDQGDCDKDDDHGERERERR